MGRWLETTNHVAQIALAVVAIFGYFYTVRPIYQKEQLAEQVPEYETIIKAQKPKIAETEGHLADLQRERDRVGFSQTGRLLRWPGSRAGGTVTTRKALHPIERAMR